MKKLKLPSYTAIKYGVIIVLFLAVLPLLNIAFLEDAPLFLKLDAFFQLQKAYLTLALCVVIFCFIAGKKCMEKSRISILFLFSGLIGFALLSTLNPPFFMALQNGMISVEGSTLYYDNLGVFGTAVSLGNTELLESGDFVASLFRVKDTSKLHERVEVGVYASIEKLSDNARLFLVVNGKEHDVTVQARSMPPKMSLLTVLVDREVIRNENIVELKLEGQAYVRVAKNHYYHEDSQVYRFGRLKNDDGMALLFIDTGERYNEAYKAAFRYKPALMALAFFLLFIGFFGLQHCRSLVKKARIEILSSVLLGIAFFFSVKVLEIYWKPLSIGALSIARPLLAIVSKNVIYAAQDVPCPQLGVEGYINHICRSSSGYESAILFTFLSIIILVTNWNRFSKLKFATAFLMGLSGTVVVNGIRIFLIISLGILYSKEFASGIFHTNVGWILFLAYSTIFWLIAVRFVKLP